MASQHFLPTALFAAAAVIATPATAQSDAASRLWLQQAFAAFDAGGTQIASGAPTPLAQAIATWDLLRRPFPPATAPLPLGVQADFILAHPDWPGVSAIRRRAEVQAADPLTPDSEALSFFRRLTPQTAAAQARYATLLTGTQALEMARAAWTRAGLSDEQEIGLLARFAGSFSKEDFARRADALMWAGQVTAAGRILSWLDSDARALTQARIALRTGTPDAEALYASVPASVRRDPGLLNDRSVWLERRNRLSESEALMARADIDPGKVTAPETWLERRLAMGRAAMRRGDNDTAYRLLANHKAYAPSLDTSTLPLSQRIDLSDTEWLAGWIALRKRNDPANAIKHFNNFRNAVNTPISMSRGDYWLGRAEKARGNRQAANAAFERAAANFDYFYGQLAAEELGRLPALPANMKPAAASSAARTAFERQELVQALSMVDAVGRRDRETLFVRALADKVNSPADARLAMEMGQRIGRADLGVWVWKARRPAGDMSTFESAYPQLPDNAPIPPRTWILSHAIARQESSFDRTAMSPVGARGLMQLMPGTARDVAAKVGLPYDADRLFSDPAYNLTLGSYYIDMRRDNFANVMMAIAAYNGGAGNVSKWITQNGDPRGAVDPIDWVEMIPFSETRNYVQRVIENAVVYSLLDPKRPGGSPRASNWLRGS